MKCHLSFTIPDDKYEYEVAVKAPKFVLADEEFKQILRNICKYDDVSVIRDKLHEASEISDAQIIDVVQAIRDIYWNNLDEHGAKIEGS